MNSTTYLTPFWIKDESGTSANFTVKILNDGQANTPQLTIYYSTDATNWNLLGNTVSGGTLSKDFSAGSKIYLSCTTNSWAKTTSTSATAAANNNRIGASKNFSVGGNIMSLIYGTTFADNRKYTTFPDDSIAGIFGGLFYNQSIIDAGELVLPVTHSTSSLPASGTPITGPLYGCYRRMFENCSSLVNGPHIDLRDRGSLDLPYCFQRMFVGCTSLMSLHINTVGANYRYNAMFNNNGGAQGGICYDFSGGPLSSAFPSARWKRICIPSLYLGYDRVWNWNSSISGDINQVDDSSVTPSVTIYTKFKDENYYEPFYVENTTSTTKTVHIKKNSNAEPGIMVQRSDDNVNWYDIAQTSTSGLTISLSQNQKVWLRANAPYGWNRTGYGHNIYGSPKVGGNIMSLVYGSEFRGYETSFLDNGRMEFLGLFKSDTTLTNITNLILPVITMGESCYKDLFNGCTNLNTVPIIDAEILSNNCFMSMFEGCTSLLTAPVLKATSLAQECYLGMFIGCTSLVNAPQLPATVLARSCYAAMFDGCTSLVNAPDLPASTLVQDCYDGMFEHCSSLNNIKCLATSGVNQNNLTDWVLGVSSTGTFTKATGVTWPTGTSGIPSGWTVAEQ